MSFIEVTADDEHRWIAEHGLDSVDTWLRAHGWSCSREGFAAGMPPVASGSVVIEGDTVRAEIVSGHGSPIGWTHSGEPNQAVTTTLAAPLPEGIGTPR